MAHYDRGPRESRDRYHYRYSERRGNGYRSRSDKEPRYHKETSNTLYVGNLSYDTSEELIEKVFEDFGKVEDVRICYNHNGTSKGFAYVEFNSEKDAIKAYNEGNIEINGRDVKLDYDSKTRGGYTKYHYRG